MCAGRSCATSKSTAWCTHTPMMQRVSLGLGCSDAAYLTAIADPSAGRFPAFPKSTISETALRRRWFGIGIEARRCYRLTTAYPHFGPSVRAALKAALKLEDVAKTLPPGIAAGQARAITASDEVQKWYARYHSTYGQPQNREQKHDNPTHHG
jgi:hypothetical protein